MRQRERDLIDQINRALQERDAQIAALLAKPEIFALGIGTTDGVGGLTTVFAFGCNFRIVGTVIRVSFQDARPNDRFSVAALPIVNAARMWVLPALETSLTSRDLRLYDDTGNVRSPATNAFSFFVWGIGMPA
jgi:hypothetical protein